MKRSLLRRTSALTLVTVAAFLLGGCVELGPGGPEAKIGIGPFKAGSVEVGPGGAEAKGPSAGPFKALDTDSENSEPGSTRKK